MDLLARPGFELLARGSADPVVFRRVGRETAAAEEGCRRVVGSGEGFPDEVVTDITISCIWVSAEVWDNLTGRGGRAERIVPAVSVDRWAST